MRHFVTVCWALWVSLGPTGCIFAAFDVEGKTCSSAEGCPGDLVCVLTSPEEGVCQRAENVCKPPPAACELTVGVCAGQARHCGLKGPELICTAASYGSGYEAVESRCDGLDNDCDGRTDNLPDAGPLRAAVCLLNQGVCAQSRQACMGGAFEQSCGLASYGPAYESFELTCDGLDNDCEGRADRSSFVEVAGDVGHFDWVVVDGGFLAAYDAPIDDGGRRAYLRRFDSRLAPMGAPVDLMGTVITFPPHYGERPRLLPTDAGVLVAWLEQPSMRDGGVDIVLGRADEQGELVPIGMGTATSTLVASVPDVTGTLALASTDTRVAIGWVEPLINGPLFRALSMSLDGVPTSPIKTLSSLSGVADSIDLTGLGRTGFFAAWNDSLKVRWQRYDDQLTATSSVDTSNLAGPASQITTRKLKEGEPLLAFIANEVPQFYVVVLPGLSSPSQTVPILGRGVPLLRVTELRQGEFAVAGTTFDSVWGAVLNASGTLGAPVSLVPDAGAPITQLALAGRNQSIAVAVTFPAEPVAGASSQRVVGERACLP